MQAIKLNVREDKNLHPYSFQDLVVDITGNSVDCYSKLQRGLTFYTKRILKADRQSGNQRGLQ